MAEQIRGLLDNIIPKQHQWKVALFKNWDEIIGTLKGKVRIEKLDGSLLILGVTHPAWAQELRMFSDMIKNKINTLLEKEVVKDIKFRTVSFKPKKKLKSIKQTCMPYQNIENVAFNMSEEASLNSVKNKELRQIMRQYYTRCKASKKEC